MLRRMAIWVVLGAVVLAPTRLWAQEERPAQVETATEPALVLRVASIDHLINSFRYLAEVSGHEDQAKSLEAMIKQTAGPKGLDGIDTKKPLGAYAYVGKQGVDSEVVVLVPYSDQDAILALLKQQGQKVEEQQDGTYKMKVENAPFDLHLRFANKYLYVSNAKTRLDKKVLAAPGDILPVGQEGTLSLTVRLNQVPKELKEVALGAMENQLAKAKDQKGKETEAQTRLKETTLDGISRSLQSVINDGRNLHLGLDLDRDASDLSLTMTLSGQDGTELARSISSLGRIRSLAASLVGKDSAMNLLTHVTLSDSIRKALLPVMKEETDKNVKKEKDPTRKELIEATWKALKPTLEEGVIDGGFDLRGPHANGKFTAVFGIKVADGPKIEGLIREAKSKMPEENEELKLDADKEGPIAIHRVNPKKNDPEMKKVLGDKPIFFAVREDAILAGAGEQGLSALKEVLAAAPQSGNVLQMEVGMRRLAPLMTDKYKNAVETARKTLKEKDSDRLRLTVEGGKTLKLRLGLKPQLLAFFSEVKEEAGGEGSKEEQDK